MKFRHEYKHQINLADIYGLRARLSAVAKHDSHCDEDGTYFVKTLYFDNYRDTALREKQDGVNKREKFRIRYYGTDTSFLRVEKKSKVNRLCNKVNAEISAEECQKIIDGDIEFLRTRENELLYELYAKMKYRLLKPRCIVAYSRECYVYPPGNVRITLDTNVCGSNNVREFLNPDLPFFQLYHNAILEVKWDAYLPQIIRDCIQIKNRRSTAFSKYAAARFKLN